MDDSLRRTISLVREAQGGKSEAMEELFARYLPRVRQIVALRLGRRPSDFANHEDIVQEALLNTFRKLDQYEERSEATFRNWVSQNFQQSSSIWMIGNQIVPASTAPATTFNFNSYAVFMSVP